MTEASATVADHSARPPGFARLASVADIPIYVHWSCFLGGVVLAAAGSFDQHLLPPLILGYLLVILIHEAGHAVAARWLGLKVFSIRLRGLGGVCITEPIPGARATLVVFSAGLVAQIALFAAVFAGRQLWDKPEGPMLAGFIYALTFGNAFAFACSLIPMTSREGRPTDGRVLLQLAQDRFHGRTVLGGTLPSMNSAALSPVFTPETALLTIAELVPPGFEQGVEILNDSQTPLDFVVDVLMRHFGSNGRQAIEQAVEIHNRGGLLMPLASVGEAERIAAAVAADAEAAGVLFVCRAVSLEA